jgi:hypothetical protein
MAIDVTVLGASGTTVTIPFTSAANAMAAQAALVGISNQVTGNSLEQVNYTGGGTLPGIATPATVGGVIATGAATTSAAPFAIGGQYISAVLGSAAEQTLLVNFGSTGAIVASGAGGSTVSGGAGSPTMVAGTGGTEIGNLGTNTQVFLGGAAVQDFSELGLGAFGTAVNPTATVWVTTPEKGTATFDDSSGSTTINLDALISSTTTSHVFGQTLIIQNEGNGQTTINIQTPTIVGGNPVDGDAMSFRGTSTVATTVNAAGGSGTSLWALLKSGNAFINGNASSIILFPTGTGVAATLIGGTGTDIDVGAPGVIHGGSGGNNILFGGTGASSSTLFGGGSGDVLVQQGANNVSFAGTGNEDLFALAAGNTLWGDTTSGNVGGSTLIDGITGNDTYITGNAAAGSVSGAGTNIFSVNDTNGGNLFKEGVVNTGTGVDANSATITGFVSGTDSISLSDPATPGTAYTTVAGSTPTSTEVAFTPSGGGANTLITFGDGTTWTILNATVHNTDFTT